jgi:biopolymer transport protein ExbB
MLTTIPLRLRIQICCGIFTLLMLTWAQAKLNRAHAQDTDPSAATSSAPAPEAAETAPAAAPKKEEPKLSILYLYKEGGIFMYPITILSVIGLIAAIDRLLALRRQRVLPDGLVTSLGQLGTTPGGFDPRRAFKICQQYPSAAANVIRTMLLRVGRPLSEVESAVKLAEESEATKLYYNVRWLNLAATTATLLGLLGTIQGMILAFHKMTALAPGADKAKELSGGIYTALVTTFAGLCVAIPAVMLAHFFEGRIQKLFHDIDDLVQSLLPQVERYEGRVRFGKQMEAEAEPPAAPVGSNR